MLRKRHRMPLVTVGAAALLCLAPASGIVGIQAAGAASSGRTTLAGSAVPASARQHPVGAVARSARVDFEVVLQLRDAAGAQSLVQALSSPGSASYRHYLTTAQWEARFSPAASEVNNARSWLRSQGFSVGAVSKDSITISASGTAAQVEQAFGTGLENYVVNGRTVRYATSDISVPSTIAGSVVGAMGINQTVASPAVTSGEASASASSTNPFPPAPPAFITAPPCGSYYGAKTTTVTPAFGNGYPTTVPDQVCGYQPNQFRSAYGLTAADSGKGATVAIIDAYGSSTIANDATRYFQTYAANLPFANANFTQDDTLPFDDESLCAASSWLTEQDIDVEAVHSMAPDANILYVGAQDCLNGLFNSEQSVIDNRLADVVTNSWGDDAGDLLDDAATKAAWDDLFMLADSTGMSIMFSSGDNGDNFNLFGFSSADYPTESPFVTSVGGTTLQIGANGQQTGQVGWSTGRAFLCTANLENLLPGCTSKAVNTWLPVSFDGGSGGFTSYNYTQPYYQTPVVPAALALRNEALDGPVPLRVEPDISMDADPASGLLMGLHETFPGGKDRFGLTRYGGTSLASPLLAGVIADADGASVRAGGADVGFINPDIYKLHSTSGAIDDIVPGGKQAQYRTDYAFTYFGPSAQGFAKSFRELTYSGSITYCDETGNCASRPNTLSTAKGYDSMTGLGSIGPAFVADLAKF